MNSDLQSNIADALGVNELQPTVAFWTPVRASIAADVITSIYKNVATASTALSQLRAYLRKAGVADAVLGATARPELTKQRNQQSEEKLKSKVSDGVQVPPQYKNVSDLRARINVFLKHPVATADTLADFLVTFCARKSESLTLKMDNGRLIGALKKRGKVESFPIISCIPQDMCERFLNMWNAIEIEDRKAAIRSLDRSCKRVYGCKVQSLREIGAYLASRSADSVGERLAISKMALRHNTGNAASTIEHYQAVVDPASDISHAAQDLDDDQHDEVLRFIKRIKTSR